MKKFLSIALLLIFVIIGVRAEVIEPDNFIWDGTGSIFDNVQADETGTFKGTVKDAIYSYSGMNHQFFQPIYHGLVVGHYTKGSLKSLNVTLSSKTYPFTIYFSNSPFTWDNLDSASEKISLDQTVKGKYSVTNYEIVPEGKYKYVAFAIKDPNEASGAYGSVTRVQFNWSYSEAIPTPSFSIAPNSDLIAGTIVKVIKPADADKIFVNINGGEFVEFSGDAEAPITEDTMITAYAMSEGNRSEEVTAFYSVEETGENIDEINPFTFFASPGNWSDYDETGYVSATSSGNQYRYYGTFKNHAGADPKDGKLPGVFNLTKSGYYLTNVGTATRSAENDQLYALKVERAAGDNTGILHVAFSDTPFDSAPDLSEATYATVSNDPNVNADYNFSQNISVKETFASKNIDKGSAGYFAIFPGNAAGAEVPRVVATYSNILTDIENIATVTGEDSTTLYDLNGRRVNSSYLLPGIYIRLHKGKPEKFIVL